MLGAESRRRDAVMGRWLSTIRVHCFADIPDSGQLVMEVLLFQQPLNGPPLTSVSISPERDASRRYPASPTKVYDGAAI